MQIHSRFGVASARRRQNSPQFTTARFVVIPHIGSTFRYSPTRTSDAIEIPLVTPGTDMPKLPQSPRKRKHPGAVGEADPRTHIEVLPGVDRVRRFYVWEQDEDDERLREEVLAIGVHWSCDL